VIMLALGAGLLLRFVKRSVIEEHLADIEASVGISTYSSLPEPDVTTSQEQRSG